LRSLSIQQQTDTQAVIAKGVDAGERVVTTGFARLKDGSQVAIGTSEESPSATPAPAQPARPNTRAACAADVQRLCAEAQQSKGGVRDCLRSNAAKLSEECKAAIANGAGRRAKEADARREGLGQ
jgi:multidrug efflux system membrane fusion protein